MPYRFPGAKRSGSFRRNALTSLAGQRDYGTQQTGNWRHEFNSQLEGTSINTGEYVEVPLLRFARSFSGVADTPPTPTASNNYQTARVFNGSKIVGFNAKLNIRSNEGVPVAGGTAIQTFYFDIYEIATSFFDAHTWNGLASTLCPVDFDTSATDEGEVDFKSTPISLTDNTQKNSKFSQHYMRKIARVQVEPGKAVTLNINRIPAKCRRANSGMFWGLIIHNENNINDSNQFDGTVWYETCFLEIPSEHRLPWIY